MAKYFYFSKCRNGHFSVLLSEFIYLFILKGLGDVFKVSKLFLKYSKKIRTSAINYDWKISGKNSESANYKIFSLHNLLCSKKVMLKAVIDCLNPFYTSTYF